MTSLPISVVINTKNSETTLAKALESVADFAAQIIVMDMKSSDKTKQVAHQFEVDFFSTDQDYLYVEPARNAALTKVTQPWVLILDADEEVSPGLKKLLKELLRDSTSEVECYFIARQNEIFGRKMTGTGWWPDFQMRLFKKGTVEWSAQIHAIPQIRGKVEYLPADPAIALLHHNFQTVTQFIDRLNRYTTIEASSVDQQNGERSEKSRKPYSAKRTFEAFSDEFLRRVFQEKGLDEGIHGFSLSLLQANYQVVTYLKKWEADGFPVSLNDQPQTLSQLRSFQKNLNYWIADWQFGHSSGVSKLIWQIRRKMRR